MEEPQEMWVWSLGWEDPLEEGMATHCSILAWRIQWTEEPGGATVCSVTKSWTQLKWLSTYAYILYNSQCLVWWFCGRWREKDKVQKESFKSALVAKAPNLSQGLNKSSYKIDEFKTDCERISCLEVSLVQFSKHCCLLYISHLSDTRDLNWRNNSSH